MMSVVSNTSNLSQLAERIELDIQRRQLSEGQMYLTAEEVGRQFGVNGRMASRAMNLLADRHILVRRRGSGTYVGPSAPKHVETDNGIAQILIGEVRLASGLPLDQLLGELNRALTGVTCQATIVPGNAPRSFIENILTRGANGSPVSGVVLIGCPREIHTVVSESGVPAVVFGTVHNTSRQLPSADSDHYEAGCLAARHLVESGAERIGVVMRDQWLPGDNLFFDGVRAALAESGLNHGSPLMRALPPDHVAIINEITSLLKTAARPDGLICRGRIYSEAAIEAIEQANLTIDKDVHVVAHVDADEINGDLFVTYVTAESDYLTQIGVVAALLSDLISGRGHDDEHTHFPVKLKTHPH